MTDKTLALRNDATLMPSTSEWNLMRDMAESLVPTGFLPEAIKKPEQALLVMLKGRELGVPPLYALSNIVVVKGKPTVSAEMMLALIYRDHGKKAIRVRESTNEHCTIDYRLPGWDVASYTFTIEDAAKAGLAGSNTWRQYPAAMLRARCISAVARMAFPECIAGMYVPGELGDPVTVTDDGEVVSLATGEIHEPAPPRNAPVARPAAPQREEAPVQVKSLPHDPHAALRDVVAEYQIPYEAVDAWVADKTGNGTLDDLKPRTIAATVASLRIDSERARFLTKYLPADPEPDAIETTGELFDDDALAELTASADRVQAAAKARA